MMKRERTRRVMWLVAMALAMAGACHRGGTAVAAGGPGDHPPEAAVTVGANARVPVRVDGEGYHPTTINAPTGAPLTLVFTRTTDETCGQRVRFPTLHIDRELPLNTPVEIAVNSPPTGALGFTCGMGMYQGSVIAR